MPSTGSLARLGSFLAVPAFVGVAAAQSPDVNVGYEFRFLGALISSLLLAGAAVGFGPRYVGGKTAEIREDPVAAFGWGLFVSIGGAIAIGLLAITVIGLLVAIPGALLLAGVGLVGTAVSTVWIGNALVGARDEITAKDAIAGAVVLALVTAIPVLGDLIGRLIGLLGVGVVGRGVYESWR